MVDEALGIRRSAIADVIDRLCPSASKIHRVQSVRNSKVSKPSDVFDMFLPREGFRPGWANQKLVVQGK